MMQTRGTRYLQQKKESPHNKSVICVSKRKNDVIRSWKEQVRDACLRRVWLSRQHQRDGRYEDEIEKRRCDNGLIVSTISPRMLLEEELRERGVNVESPCHQQETFCFSEEDVAMEDAVSNNEESQDINPYTMTEDEFLTLLEDIESELAVRLAEEQWERENEMMQEQIAYFESQTSDQQHPCPLCAASLLSVFHSDGSTEIFCNGRFDRPCSFRLAAGVTTLDGLKQRMEAANTAHLDYCASGATNNDTTYRLAYSNPSPAILTASCRACGTYMTLYG